MSSASRITASPTPCPWCQAQAEAYIAFPKSIEPWAIAVEHAPDCPLEGWAGHTYRTEAEAVAAWSERDLRPRLLAALEEIADPIVAMQKRADAEGKRLDGMMANHLASDPHYLRGIARAAIAADQVQS